MTTKITVDRNYGSMMEAVADAVGDRPALVQGERRTSWRELDDRASRLAAAFRAAGCGRDSKVACYLYNSNEYVETVIAAFKVRAAPVNVNYRYVEAELEYLLENADAEVVVFHGDLADRVAAVRDRLPKLRLAIQVDESSGNTPGSAAVESTLLDGALPYEEAIASHGPMDRIERSGEDLLFIYTGGTTGMPKGVMWRCEDILLGPGVRRAFEAAGIEPPTSAADIGERIPEIVEKGQAPVHMSVSPMMHGAGLGSALGALLFGGTLVNLPARKFDAHELWQTVQREGVTQMTIVGDPFAKPMLRALEEARSDGRPYDISSVKRINSTGAMWSAPVKEGLLKHGGPDLVLQDGLASSEALAMGVSVTKSGAAPGTAKFQIGANCAVLTEHGREVTPGSGEIGLLAVSDPIPVGYYKDPEKTARTFREVNGKRYSIPGDWAQVESDGTITLLGRGSVCINTGGEKVFPEEVEEVLKEHPSVADCVVVGIPDDTWGEAITAVLSYRPGSTAGLDELVEAASAKLARYKHPKHVVVVDEVYRAPSGKADYGWAKRLATERVGSKQES